MAKMVDVVASKPTTEKIQTKLGYVDNMSDALAYVNFPLLIPGAVTAVLSVLFVVLATVMAYYSEQQRFTDHTMTRWLSNGGGGVKFRNECMVSFLDQILWIYFFIALVCFPKFNFTMKNVANFC